MHQTNFLETYEWAEDIFYIGVKNNKCIKKRELQKLDIGQHLCVCKIVVVEFLLSKTLHIVYDSCLYFYGRYSQLSN